jgi:predicted nucleic acid-binding protein
LRVVIDASVVVKWVLPEPERENHVERALRLLGGDLQDGRIEVLQPPHWLTEVAAVLTRLRPETVEPALDLLGAMELPTVDDVAVLKQASRLARQLHHHLFDTLYHAVALERDASLVTADDHYLRKARDAGRLISLQSWSGPEGSPAGPVRLRLEPG